MPFAAPHHFSILQVTAPEDEPITLAEAKAFLRVDASEDDAIISGFIAAARRKVEVETGHQLCEAGFEMYLDGFPSGVVRIPKPPMMTVDKISYLSSGAWVELAEAAYDVDVTAFPARVMPLTLWPSADARMASVKIEFTAGYGDPADIPEDFKLAMQMLIVNWYTRRDMDGIGAHEKLAFDMLVKPFALKMQ
jgi:uncharacterized phiE125 gp8 family phage protein